MVFKNSEKFFFLECAETDGKKIIKSNFLHVSDVLKKNGYKKIFVLGGLRHPNPPAPTLQFVGGFAPEPSILLN